MSSKRKQPAESDGTGKTTKGGRDPPNVTLDEIAEDLFSFFKEDDNFNKTEENITKKCDVKQDEHNCWPEDDIKRAWGEIRTINSDERKDWSVVIILQMLKRRFVCAECKPQAAQENRHAVQLPLSQGQAGRHGWSQDTGNSPGAADRQDRTGEASQNDLLTIYLRIPFTVMLRNELVEEKYNQQVAQPPVPYYKLVDGNPSASGDRHPSASQVDLKKKKSYAMSFNDETNNANWVYEILNKNTLYNDLEGRAGFEAPYQKGHLAAAANHRWCRKAFNDVNSFSNIVPQHKTLNTGPWYALEEDCRDKVRKDDGIRNVHVYSGPLYLRPMNPKWIQDKEVPSHFFKVVIVENKDGTVEKPKCYKFPNGNLPQENLKHFTKHIESIENIQRDSKLTFIDPRPIVKETDQIIIITLMEKGKVNLVDTSVKLDHDIDIKNIAFDPVQRL